MSHSFDVSAKEIRELDPYAFVEVINHILTAEAYHLCIPIQDVIISSNITAPDAGIDAQIQAPTNVIGSIIPSGISVWQFKAGGITPKKIEKEFSKPGVQQAIRNGATYCLLMGNDADVTSRKNQLEECFRNIGLDPKCIVLNASQIANWASQYPAIALLPCFNHPVGDARRFENWARVNRYQNTFVPDKSREDIIGEIRAQIKSSENNSSIRIEGDPGVGKTRLAMEALRINGLQELVIYASDLGDIPTGFLGWLRKRNGISCILVIDECAREKAQDIYDHIQGASGRINLITIGQGKRSLNYPQGFFVLEQLDNEAMDKIVAEGYPILSPESKSFVIKMASGFVKLATAMADTLSKNHELTNAIDLSRYPDINEMLSKLIPDQNQLEGVKAIALMCRVGWEGDVANEGKELAKFMDIEWGKLQDIAVQMYGRGLITKQGRYRYVTPLILAVWLAGSLWESRGHDLIGLVNSLPSLESKKAFIERIADLGEHEKAKDVVRSLFAEDGIFPDLTSLEEPFRSEILSSLANVDAYGALEALERILGDIPSDELKKLNGDGRRYVIWTLEKLAWLPETFPGSARILLALAEAENENFANNATGTWVGLFQTLLGGTAVPAIERHHLIKETLESSSIERRKLAVQAIGTALRTRSISRTVGAEHQGGRIVPPEWRPRTMTEAREVYLSALSLLRQALDDDNPEVVRDAMSELAGHIRELASAGLVNECLDIVDSLPLVDYYMRSRLREAIEHLIEYEGKSLSVEQIDRAKTLCQKLAGNTFRDRLRRYAGRWTSAEWQAEEERKAETTKLATEAIGHPEYLYPELDWLVSTDAEHVGYFAARLGELDKERRWFEEFVKYARRGVGLTVIACYLMGKDNVGEIEWIENTLDVWARDSRELAEAVLETTWRREVTERSASRLILLVDKGWLKPALLRVLNWVKDIENIPLQAFKELLCKHIIDESKEVSMSTLEIVCRRLRKHPYEHRELADLSWKILECPTALKEWGNLSYYWAELASFYITESSLRLAKIIISISDLFKHSHYAEVLSKATKISPHEIWDEIGNVLLKEDMSSFRLRLALQGWYLSLFDVGYLLDWADQNKPHGPHILALLSTPHGTPLADLPRELLIRYGTDKKIGKALSSSIYSGSYSGPTSEWLKGKMNLVEAWAHDPDCDIRKWAEKLKRGLQEDIEQHKLREEEREF